MGLLRPTLAVRVRGRAALAPPLLALLLALLALPPRVVGLADFLTTDEAYHWVTRTERFSAALARGDWAATVQTGHPGVTNMWLGSLGLTLERTAVALGWPTPAGPLEHLAWLRLPGALLEAALVPAAFLLLRRLVHPATALIAAALWATAPFLIAHARLLHLDALLTAFVTFSLLLLLAAFERWPTADRRATADDQPPSGLGVPASHAKRQAAAFFALSAVAAGLALLTKGPALILLPVAGLLLLWRVPAHAALEQKSGVRDQESGEPWLWYPENLRHHGATFLQHVLRRLARAALLYVAWLGLAALTALLLWPALWGAPQLALSEYVGEIVSNGGRPNGDGQFFLGRAVDDPGPLFYLVAGALRSTPASLLGLLALPLALLHTGRPAEVELRERRTLLALAGLALFWTLVMSLGPKKFDRYVLPAWPAALVLAGAGWAALLRAGAARGGVPRLAAPALLTALLALDGALLLPYHPYYLSYYNPALGGGARAQQLLLLGWGEGMDQVGAALRERPDLRDGPVLSALPPTLQPFVPVPVLDVAELGRTPANYAVVYRESIQRAADPPRYAQIEQTVPLRRINIGGIEYARIYQLPKPFALPVGARFGQALHLRGVTVARQPGRLVVTPSWDVRGRLDRDYTLFVHLLDARGERVGGVDVAPGGGSAPPTGAWEPGQQLAVPIDMALPAQLPPGNYQLVLGLYDPASGERLPFEGARAADRGLAGPHSVLVDVIKLTSE